MARKPKEEQSPKEEATPEQEQADAAAGFKAGFEGADGTPPAPEPEPVEPAAGTTAPAAEPAAAAPATEPQTPAEPAQPESPAPADEPKLAGLTEVQIKALLAQSTQVADMSKQLRNAFGMIGELKQRLTQSNAAPVAAEQKVKIELKRLTAEYPDIAPLLAEDLAELPSGSSQAQIDAAIETRVQSHLKEASDQRVKDEIDALADAHPDWEAVRDSDDLDLWLSTQAEDYRAKFRNTNSAAFVSRGLDKFKSWKEQGDATRQRNADRLNRAITPKGGGGPGPQPLTDQAAFSKGFESG
jgi:hypothetical protein